MPSAGRKMGTRRVSQKRGWTCCSVTPLSISCARPIPRMVLSQTNRCLVLQPAPRPWASRWRRTQSDRRAVGCGGIAAVRAGDCAADYPTLSGRVSTRDRGVLLPLQLQSQLSERGRYRRRLDVALPLRDQRWSSRADVREPSIGFALAPDAPVRLRGQGSAARGLYERLAMTAPRMTFSPLVVIACTVQRSRPRHAPRRSTGRSAS
jgi:hypothetical protein